MTVRNKRRLTIEDLSKIQLAALRYAAGRPGGTPPARSLTWRSLEGVELVAWRKPTGTQLGGYFATEAGTALLDGTDTRPKPGDAS